MSDNAILRLQALATEEATQSMPAELVERVRHDSALGKLLDEHSFQRLRDKATGFDYPCIAFLGAFNSAKTTTINRLLENGPLLTSIKPTTSVITALRSVRDKPKDWPDAPIQALKPGAPIRSLNPADIACSYEWKDLAAATTYDAESTPWQVVVVWINSAILDGRCLLDVPGIGTAADQDLNSMSDAERDAVESKLSREVNAQLQAIAQADGYVILSNMQAGAFRDESFAYLLSTVAKKGTRFPGAIAHSNLLLVGSNADPTRQDLGNADNLIQLIQDALAQVYSKNLDREAKSAIDLDQLKQCACLFYTLDQYQRDQKLKNIIEILRGFQPDLDEVTLQKKANEQLNKELNGAERVIEFIKNFNGPFQKQVHAGTSARRYLRTAELARLSARFLEEQASESRKLHEASKIARYFSQTREAREQAWQDIESWVSDECGRQKRLATAAFAKKYDDMSNKSEIYRLLELRYGDDKNLCKAQGPMSIMEDVQKAAEAVISEHLGDIGKGIAGKLLQFDKDYMSGHATIGRGRSIADAGAAIDCREPLISSSKTFVAVAATLAGGTTLLAALGVPAALSVFGTVVGGGIAVTSAAGLGFIGAALVSIPVWGWVLGAIGAIAYGIFSYFAWRDGTAKDIAKQMAANRARVLAKINEKFGELIDQFESELNDSLVETKNKLNASIDAFHRAAGVSSPDRLEQTVRYLESKARNFDQLAQDLLKSQIGGGHG